MYRVFLALLLAPALAGCATVSSTLSPEQVAGFRLTGVNVGFAPDARIAWGEGELAYAASKGVASQESVRSPIRRKEKRIFEMPSLQS